MKITVKTLIGSFSEQTGQIFDLSFNVQSDDTIKSLVKKIATIEGARSLITTSPILFNDNVCNWTYGEKFSDYNISEGDKLRVVTPDYFVTQSASRQSHII